MNVDKSRGFIVLYRSIEEHLLWTHHPPAYLKVWIYCLLRATYKPRKYWDGHKEVELPIGGFVSGSIEMAKKCNISRGQVRRALEVFESSQMLTSKPTNKFTVYVVVNFERYQNANLETGHQTTNNLPSNYQQPAINLPSSGHKQQREQREQEEQEEQHTPQSAIADAVAVPAVPKARKTRKPKPELPPDLFEEFWAIVWYKVDKKAAKAAWDKIVKDEAGGRRLIALAIQQGPILKAQAEGRRNPLYPSTWLNKERFEDELLLPGFEPSDPDEEAAKQKRILAAINRDRAKEGLPPQESL